MFPLDDEEYKYIASTVYNFSRINLTEKKRPLIIARLSKRIRKLNLSGFPDYVDLLKNDPPPYKEFHYMVDILTTNFTSFFREQHHIDFLINKIYPKQRGELKIWSAASSSGQEIYSILISIMEYQKKNKSNFNYKLFASDISRDALTKASRGVFKSEDLKNLDPSLIKSYFLRGSGENEGLVKIKKELIRKIMFFRLNLMDEVYKLPPMDIIFLRNVIIYFDRETKQELIERLYQYIKPGGHLILGHSESLSGISERFETVGQTIYKRREE